jgi:hypothetical protein
VPAAAPGRCERRVLRPARLRVERLAVAGPGEASVNLNTGTFAKAETGTITEGG